MAGTEPAYEHDALGDIILACDAAVYQCSAMRCSADLSGDERAVCAERASSLTAHDSEQMAGFSAWLLQQHPHWRRQVQPSQPSPTVLSPAPLDLDAWLRMYCATCRGADEPQAADSGTTAWCEKLVFVGDVPTAVSAMLEDTPKRDEVDQALQRARHTTSVDVQQCRDFAAWCVQREKVSYDPCGSAGVGSAACQDDGCASGWMIDDVEGQDCYARMMARLLCLEGEFSWELAIDEYSHFTGDCLLMPSPLTSHSETEQQHATVAQQTLSSHAVTSRRRQESNERMHVTELWTML